MKWWCNRIAVVLLIAYPINLIARPSDEILITKSILPIANTTLEQTTNQISSSLHPQTLPTPTIITDNNDKVSESKSIEHNLTEATQTQRIQTSTQSGGEIEFFQEIGVTIQSKHVPFKQSTEHLQLPAKYVQHHEKAKAHQGIAVPMTLEEMEQEMASADLKRKDSSTSKDGISTWILLNSINSTPQPEKLHKSGNSKVENKKNDKIAKRHDTLPKPHRLSSTATVTKMDLQKNKNKLTTTESTITTVTLGFDLPQIKQTDSKVNQQKNKLSEQKPSLLPLVLKQEQQQLKHKTSASMEQTVVSLSSNKDKEDTNNTKEFGAMVTTTELSLITSKPTTKEIPTPFLVLEPKDADFDLPQDRSPGKTTTKISKRTNNKNKKKNVLTNSKLNNQKPDNLAENKNSTKITNKIKNKPMSTKIYNYLSREVMPTVGVGLLGLVVTAGLAGYFFGPLGALRRSYDVADRKDDLYYYNNEEYAGPGADGQSEEEVFGKVIAGMPANSNYRSNIQYPHNQQRQRLNPYHGPQQKFPAPQYYHYRNNGPHQHLSTQNLVYNAHNQQHLQRNHKTNGGLLSPNIISQKSINSSPIFAMPQAHQLSSIIVTSKSITSSDSTPMTTTTVTSPSSIPDPAIIQLEKSNEILPLEESSESSVIKLTDDLTADYFASPINLNVLKPRKSQFVVGSILPADATETINRSEEDATIILPEHGPRRRRRRSTEPTVIENELKQVELLYNSLKKRFDKSEKYDKVTKEIKHVDYLMVRLRRIVAEIADIEQFQTELHIIVENSELHHTLTVAKAEITSNIKFILELLDNPSEINEKIKNRVQMTKKFISSGKVNQEKVTNQPIQKKIDGNNIINPVQSLLFENPTSETTLISTTFDYDYSPIQPTGLLGLLKFIELKAAFGVNVLRSIRPAFDQAFENVFRLKKVK